MTPPLRPQSSQAVAVRGQLLVRLADAPRPSFRQLAADLGLTPSAVDHHVGQLAAEGLVVRGRALALTPAGRTLATYLGAQAAGESALRRIVRRHWGRYSRLAVSALRSIAAREDAAYAVAREGLRRTTPRGRELERKATARAILAACRRHSTLTAAARAVGLQTGALEQRVEALVSKAKRALLMSAGGRP